MDVIRDDVPVEDAQEQGREAIPAEQPDVRPVEGEDLPEDLVTVAVEVADEADVLEQRMGVPADDDDYVPDVTA